MLFGGSATEGAPHPYHYPTVVLGMDHNQVGVRPRSRPTSLRARPRLWLGHEAPSVRLTWMA